MKIHNILPNFISFIDGVHHAMAIVFTRHRHHADYEEEKYLSLTEKWHVHDCYDRKIYFLDIFIGYKIIFKKYQECMRVQHHKN